MEMNFHWVLISLWLSASASGDVQLKSNQPAKRHQRSIDTLKCVGLHCNVRYSRRDLTKRGSSARGVGPRTTGEQSKESAKKTPLAISFLGSFLKLMTRGLLKRIVLPAIVRLEDTKRARQAEKLIKITRAQ